MNQEKKLNKKGRVIRIYNLSEDVWPFIDSFGSKKQQTWEIKENANLADKDLFAMADEKEFTFITARPLDKNFVSYYKKLCNIKDLEILVPKKHTGLLCKDIERDKKIMKHFVHLGKTYGKLLISCYSTTSYFISLIKKLKKLGIKIETPESPKPANAWTVNFYGSKSGIRQLTQINGAYRADLRMPSGVISHGIVDSARIAANKYVKEGGVVIKTNKGHAGAGVLIFRPGELSVNFKSCVREIIEVLKKDKYWSKFPIVVESLVDPNMRIGGGFPNAEFFVRPDGEVEFLYTCGMRVSSDGVFAGIEIGEEALPKRVASRITDIGYLIGEQYAKDGYVGYFDVDFIAEKAGDIYLSESNVRVTGGTHVYEAGKALVGKGFTKKNYILSNNMWGMPNKNKTSFLKTKKILKKVLFNKLNKEGLVICSANLLADGYLSYIIFGKNRKRAESIERRMIKLVKKNTPN